MLKIPLNYAYLVCAVGCKLIFKFESNGYPGDEWQLMALLHAKHQYTTHTAPSHWCIADKTLLITDLKSSLPSGRHATIPSYHFIPLSRSLVSAFEVKTN